jgi:2-methylisocitrate lyase-like PEP mutase family enzyme
VISKRCGHLGGKELVDEDTYLARIRAAASARERVGDIVLIARTDALQSLGFDESIARLKKAVDAGADVAFLEGMTTKDEMEKCVKAMVSSSGLLLSLTRSGPDPLSPEYGQWRCDTSH